MKELGAYIKVERYPTTKDTISVDIDRTSDEYVEELIKHRANLVWHPAGSCKMGRTDDPDAVVDPQLR